MPAMKKTTVRLTRELTRSVQRVATERGISASELIRGAIRHELEIDRPPARGALFAGMTPLAIDTETSLRGFGER
jgi:metal-responsive CopG/Arc/MetJ family transcriptional regulator